MRIVIFGGGKVGKGLLRALEGQKHKIMMVEESREICDGMAAESKADIICGDVTNPEVLEQLKLEEADYVLAVTGNEETNFLVSVYAKSLNAKRVISRASEEKYSGMMERLGVEPLITELTLARELANMVLHPLISTMLDPSDSDIEMLEKEVNGGMNEKKVADVNEEKNFTIISVYDKGKFLFPSSDFVLKEGMKIVVVKHNV